MTIDNDSVDKETALRKNINDTLAIVTKCKNDTAALARKVYNRGNTTLSFQHRFERECVSLKDNFVKGISPTAANSLKFYFKNKFFTAPKVILTFKSILFTKEASEVNTTIAPTGSMAYNLFFSLNPSLVTTSGFSYAVKLKETAPPFQLFETLEF